MHGFSSIKKALLILGILNVVAGGFYVYFIFSIQGKKAYVDEQSVVVQEQITERTNLALIQTILRERESDQEKIDRQFIDAGKEVDFAIALESLGKRSNIAYEHELRTVDPSVSDPKNKTPYTFLHVTVKTEGTWSNTVQFLSLVESYERYITVDSFELGYGETGLSDSSGPRLWRGVFVFSALVERK